MPRPHTRLDEMRRRPMRGWIRVESEGVKTRRQLRAWVRREVEFARTLAPKGMSVGAV